MDSTNYLYDVAKDQGVKLVVGDLYDGGSGLSDHVKHIRTLDTGYNYYKTEDGTWTTKTGSNLLTGLLDEDWDIIVMMERGSNATGFKKEELDEVFDYLNTNKTNPNAKFAWFTTWRYHSSTIRANLATDFGGSVHEMSDRIRALMKEQIQPRGEFTWFIPAVTAVDNISTGFKEFFYY